MVIGIVGWNIYTVVHLLESCVEMRSLFSSKLLCCASPRLMDSLLSVSMHSMKTTSSRLTDS